MKPWKRVEPTTFVKATRRGIVVKSFELPDGQVWQFDTFDQEGVKHAGVIALTADSQVLIAEQFRAGPEKVMQELPGGTVETGEDERAAVERELLEETGYKAGRVEPLGVIYKDAYMNASWHYFIAWDCTQTDQGQQLDEDEHISTKLISIDELLNNARGGRMTDTDAVFLAYEKLLEVKGGKHE